MITSVIRDGLRQRIWRSGPVPKCKMKKTPGKSQRIGRNSAICSRTALPHCPTATRIRHLLGRTLLRVCVRWLTLAGRSLQMDTSQIFRDSPRMNIIDLIVGKPLRTTDERAEQIGPPAGVSIFGLDGLSSAAYGPEAALSLLIPLGLLGVRYIVPISVAIITLLIIVYFSYLQTIAAYPTGGGSYTVARFNLGASASLLAAAALLSDYILTAAVGISAGVGALVSAVPSLLSHTVSLCVGILVVITILNLRGVREAGSAFAVPTYLFVGTLLITIVAGVLRVLLSGGNPTPAVPLPPAPAMTEAVSFWLLLKVFASGCTALTGVEAVSNGVKAFREPTVKNAQRTLTV